MTTHDNDKAHEAAERELMDAEGENRAVRCFLTLYGGAGAPTIKAMRDHLCMSGFGGYWPKWTEADRYGCHLTKAGAQDWLRYLFNRESSALTASEAKTRPVEYQYRMRPLWRHDDEGWSEWEKCSVESYQDYIKTPVSHGQWQYEARALYVSAPSSPPEAQQPAVSLDGKAGV